jgi:hypothetical protein
MIRSFRIENFRCLRDVTVPLGSLTVIIGKNDTGKSSFLDAVSYLSGIIPVGSREYPDGFFVEELAWRGADPPRIGWTVEMEISGQAASYSLNVAPSPGHLRFRILSERLEIQGLKDLIIRDDSRVTIRGWQGEIDQASGQVDELTAIRFGAISKVANPHKQVGDLLQSTTIYKIDPVQVASASLIEPDGTMTIGTDGSGVASFLDTLLNQDRDAFVALEKEISLAIPEVKISS